MWQHGLWSARRAVCWLSIAGFCGVVLAAEGEPPPAKPQAAQQMAALVQQLGSESYSQRAAAAKQLMALGLAAQQPLTAGLKHSDPQVRRSSRWLLADVMEADFQQRLEAFKADTEDKQDHRIPGWERFRRTVGADPKARELFVEMLKAESGLLESAAAGPAASTEALKLRLSQVFRLMHSGDPRERKMPSLGTSAAVLFIAADPQVDLVLNAQEESYLMNVVQQPDFHRLLSEGNSQQSALRKLVGQWMLRPTTMNMVWMKLNLAAQYDVKEGVELALQAMKDKTVQQQPHWRMQAINVIGKLGGKDYAAVLEGLLGDQTELFRGAIGRNKQLHVQVRDVALAWLIYITGQDHTAYGMDQLAKQDFENVRKNRHYMPNFPHMGFPDAQKRDEALGKWRAYVAANPLPKLPTPPSGSAQRGLIKPGEPQAAQPAKEDEAADSPFRGVTLELADRLKVQSLNLARQLCRRGEYSQAVQLLDGILADPSDYAFQPELAVPLLRCLKPEAENLIGQLPAEGRKAYETQFAVESQRAVAEAVKAGDVKALTAVAGRFFHTPAGAEASYLLAIHHMERGHPFHAALYLQRLRNRSVYADPLEPALSLALATCWARAGLPELSNEVLRRLAARYPQGKVSIGGRPRELFARAEESLRWLESFAGPSLATATGAGWLMFRGNPARNVITEVGGPLLRGKPLLPMYSDADLARAVEKLRQEHAEQYRVAMPRLHPLVVGGTILLRTATHLVALEAAGGKILWEAPLEDSLRLCLLYKQRDAGRLQTDAFVQAVRRRFWEDLTYGTLSSDGRYVFGVEDVSFGFGADYQRLVVGPDGRRRLDTESQKKYNLLTAHDIRTGKLKWELGGSPGPGMRALSGMFFLGPPLPLGGRLYVVGDTGSESRLLELEAETGAVVSELTLALREKETAQQQMFFWPVPSWMLGGSQRRGGASPSCAEGVLVCRAGENQYVGVNLATRAVLWVYQLPDRDDLPRNGFMFGVFQQRRMMEAFNPDQANRWADGSVTIAEGRALLTPPDSNELFCLDLHDGRLLWSAPRRDGLYVGGVVDGRAIVVGRGAVWALKLSDGQLAWPHDRLILPAGALPSGSGLVSQGRYLLPLSTGEVAAVDVRSGRLVARSRSAERIVPGNLVVCHDSLLSQSDAGLWRFDLLQARDRQLAAALGQRPNDPDLLLERAEVLLGIGQIREAVDLLQQAIQTKASPRSRQLLADALIDGLRADFDTFVPLAEKLEAVIEQTEGRARFLQELAQGLQQAGRVETAFETYLKLIDATAKPEELERYETARQVRRDRWIAARLQEVYGAATPDQRAKLDPLILARRQDDRLRPFLAFFGFHPAAHETRLCLARQSADKKEYLEAEQLLRRVLSKGSAEEHRAAAARLAMLLREAKQPEDAARFYQYLRTDLADVACLDGKKGRELVDALPEDDPIRLCLGSSITWPAGKVRTETLDKKPREIQHFPLSVMFPAGRFDGSLFVDVDMNNRHVTGCDSFGRTRWQFSMAEKEQQWQFVSWPDPYSTVWPNGHYLLVWIGNRVGAVDTFGEKGKVLWVQETMKVPQQLAAIGWGFPVRMRMQGQAVALPASDPLPLVPTANGVCFLQGRNLVAVDPLTGQTLWSRDDATIDSTLFGDEELLLVTPPESQQAMVLSMIDGREVGRCRVPPLAERLWTFGRQVCTWKSAPEKCQLALVDPWAGQTLWQREFAAKAQSWLIEADELAVLDPEGKLEILALPSGTTTLQGQLDARPKLDGLYVQRSATGYVVVAKDVGSQGQVMFMQPFMGHWPVSGRVYGLDRRTGKLRWSADVDQQALKLNQPSDLPVLCFCNQTQIMENQRFSMRFALLCLDKRNGRVLHSPESKQGNANLLEIVPEVDKGTVEVRSFLGSVKFTFTNEPAQ